MPFFAAGLGNGERCTWVTCEPFGAVDAKAALARVVPDAELAFARGDIEILDHEEWYTRSGAVDADGVIRGWLEREEAALAAGYDGYRLSGNVGWLPRSDWGSFVEYEERVNEAFRDRKILGLCSYALGQCDPSQLVEVVKNHDLALVRRTGEWHVFESSSLRAAKDELARLNAQLEARVEQRTAELEAALRTRDEFLSVASHELKTPISSLALYVDGLLRNARRGRLDGHELTSRLERAREQCARLDRLVTSLLDVSRAGHVTVSPKDVDLVPLVRAALERFEVDAARAGATLRLDAPDTLTGRWDPVRIEQIVANLVSNALRYAPASPVEVSLRRDGDRVRLEVRDDGPGIAPADHERIFERFVQGRAASAGGFGVGLWVVRQIARAMGGDATVESATGAGARFTIDLPTHVREA